jgi:hypothetical protein
MGEEHMRRLVVPVLLVAVLAAAAAAVGFGTSHETARAKGLAALSPVQQRLVSGFARQVLQARSGFAPQARPQARPSQQRSTQITGCPVDRGSNLRVNQNCLNQADPDIQGRAQAQNETAVAQDPNDPSHLVASSNDYRRGDGNCYAYDSQDGGKSWDDSTAPMSFTRGTAFGGFARQYWQAGGDTSVAWDTKGNAYLSCQMFNRGTPTSANPDQSSAFYVFRSTGTDGTSWNFPARPVAELNDTAGTGEALLDKQYLTVDDQKGSPFQDRLYVTWTLFAPDGTGYIYEAYSRDYGESGRKGSASNSGPRSPSRRSAGSRSRSVGTRAPMPVPSSSQPRIAPSFQRIAKRVRAGHDGSLPGSPAARPCTSSGKSSGPPGVGRAHTSSSRKSGASAWIRQGREVCSLSGSLMG